MFKFVVLFAAVAALASSATLKISTNELHTIFEIVETGVHQLQEDAELRVLDIEEGIQSYTEAVTARLVLAIEEVNQEFHDRVEQIDEEARNEEEVDRCIKEATEQLEELDSEIIEHTVEELVKESREVLETAQQLVQDAVEELERLRGEVENCHEERCADELADEIEDLQGKIAGEIAEALNTAHAIVQALESESAEFDLREYEEAVRALVEQVELCSEDRREDEEDRREEEEEERREEEEEERREEEEEERREEEEERRDQ